MKPMWKVLAWREVGIGAALGDLGIPGIISARGKTLLPECGLAFTDEGDADRFVALLRSLGGDEVAVTKEQTWIQ